MARHTDPDGPDGRAPRWRSWILPIVLGVLLLGVLTTSVVLVGDRHDARSDPVTLPRAADVGPDAVSGPGPSVAAVRIARRAAIAFYDVDRRHLRRGVRRLGPIATTAFEQRYVAKLRQLRGEIERRRLVLRASVPTQATATEYLGQATAQVLVGVDVATSAGGGRSSKARYRVRLTLTRSDSSWLVTALEQVG